MQISIHSDAVARNFSSAALRYEQWAGPQRRVAEGLAGLLPETGPVNAILDVGCGTGYLTGLLYERYPDACILGIDVASEMINTCRRRWADTKRLSFHTADAERFDCRHRFDLVASSFCFQWFCVKGRSIRRLAEMLKSGGMFACAVPVAGTLGELHETYRFVLREKMPGLEYISSEMYGELFAGAGLRPVFFREETVQGLYRSGLQALRAFKEIGATFRHHWGYSPLSAADVKKIVRHYERSYALADGRIPLTYKVLYIIAENIQ